MKTTHTIPLAIAIGGVIVALAVFFSSNVHLFSPEASSGDQSLVRAVSSADHILGNPLAPIKIVTYSDYDCDYCKEFHTVMNRVIADRGSNGRVAWVLRQFPLTEIHENAMTHAEAAECVAATAGNDAFFAFSATLFDHQPADPKTYGALAQQTKVPAKPFTDCYTNAATTVDERIKKDRQNALDAGARGTPYSVLMVKDKPAEPMDGAYTYDAVIYLIDQQSGF